MGMTVVEKILARASGRAAVHAGDVVEPARRPRHVARERGAGPQPVPRGLPGHRPRAEDLGPVADRHHLRPPRPRRVPEDRHQPEEGARVRGRSTGSPASTTSAATRAASATRSCPRTATSARARSWSAPTPTPPATARSAPSPSASAPPRWPASGRSASRSTSRCRRRSRSRSTAASPRSVGPKDLILHLVGLLTAEGANFRVIEFHGETIRKMSTSGRLTLCNMTVEAGATSGIVPGDDETVRYLREEAGRDGPDHPRHPRRRRRLRARDQDRRLDARAADRLPAHRRQRQADRRRRRARRCTRSSSAPAPTAGSTTSPPPPDILRGKKVAKGTRMLVFPASGRIYQQALEQGLRARPDEGRRRGHELRLRPLPRRPRGRARRRRGGPLHHQPQLQGPHGQPELRGLPLLARGGRRLGAHRRHHRPAEGGVAMATGHREARRRHLDRRHLPRPLHGHGAAHRDPAVRVRGQRGAQRQAQGEAGPAGQRDRGRQELRLRLLARAGLLLPQGLRADDRGSRASPASSCRTRSTSASTWSPRPTSRRARATSWRSTADKVVNKTTGKSFADRPAARRPARPSSTPAASSPTPASA